LHYGQLYCTFEKIGYFEQMRKDFNGGEIITVIFNWCRYLPVVDNPPRGAVVIVFIDGYR
jgi:hypothetical protein